MGVSCLARLSNPKERGYAPAGGSSAIVVLTTQIGRGLLKTSQLASPSSVAAVLVSPLRCSSSHVRPQHRTVCCRSGIAEAAVWPSSDFTYSCRAAMRSVGVYLVLVLSLAVSARCAPGGEEQAARARLMFGGSSSQEAAPRTVTRLVLRREWVTSTTPSSCVVVQTSLPACRNLRHLGPHLRPSATVTRIEPTRAATLDEVEGGAEGRTFGWFRGSSTEAAPAPQVVSGRTPALVLPDTVVGGETVQLVVQQQAQPQQVVVAAPATPPLTRTLVLQPAARPAAAEAQLVYANPQDSAQVFVVEQAPQPQLQQVYIAGTADQQAVQGGTIIVEGAQPQQQVVAVQKGEQAHRYSLGEWLGLSSPAAPPAAAGGAASVVTVQGTLLQTATRAYYDPQHVVTFSVTGCEPTRLPFDLDYCEGHRPSKAAAAKGAPGKNVITIQEGAAEE